MREAAPVDFFTTDELARLVSCARRWNEIGVNGADFRVWKRAERLRGHDQEHVGALKLVRVSSPLAGAFAFQMAGDRLAAREILGTGSLPSEGKVRALLNAAVRAGLRSPIRTSVDCAVEAAMSPSTEQEKRSYNDWEIALAFDEDIKRGVYAWIDAQFRDAYRSAICSAMGSAVDSGIIAEAEAVTMAHKLAYGVFGGGRSVLPLKTPIGLVQRWANEHFAIACGRPERLCRDREGRIHCEDAQAVQWSDGSGLFAWHGTAVPGKLIMNPGGITRDEIISETNSEVSRAYAERVGWERYFKLADVVRIDAWRDLKTGLHYELYDFRRRLGDRQPRLLKMESPKIMDGSSPVYIEPVDPGLRSARAARCWQFMRANGTWPTVLECNQSPELTFGWEA